MRKIINTDLTLDVSNGVSRREFENFNKSFLELLEQHAQRENSLDIIKLNVGNASVEVVHQFISGLTSMLDKYDFDKNVIFMPVGEALPIKDITISRVVVEEVNNVEENNREGKTETT